MEPQQTLVLIQPKMGFRKDHKKVIIQMTPLMTWIAKSPENPRTKK